MKAKFAVSHRKNARFEKRGLRTYFEYRDLGIKRATRGKVVAHVIRARPGKAPHGQWHRHDCKVQFVYVLKNNGTTEFALRGGNAQSGNLSTYFKGALPGGGWSPMKKQGAIVLGSGGDCCKPSGGANLSAGTFYEGCIVTGYPTDATEDAVQANVVAAGYGK